MIPVLGKINSIFAYIQDENGKSTRKTRDEITINPEVYTVTAKLDGTCCYIKDGQIFARQDIKKDISNAPVNWFPTAGTKPDKGGHIIGFRPFNKGDKWHLKAIDAEDSSKALFLEYDRETKLFHYSLRSIADYNGKTCELVGPGVNGNKHGLDKNAYIIHGSIIVDAPWKTHKELREWLECDGVMYEGIVIHDIGNNMLYKCHRGHLGGLWDGYPLPLQSNTISLTS